MSAHRDPTLRRLLALDDARQAAELAAWFGEPHTTAPRPAPTGGTFTPYDGTLGPSPKGGLSWKPAPWPTHVVNGAGRDLIHVCIDHSHLKAECKRSPAGIAAQRARIERWRRVRGIYTVRGYGAPETWTPATIALVLRDVLSAIPQIHDGITPDVDAAIVRASSYQRRGHKTPSDYVVRAEAAVRDDDTGLLRCTVYFSVDASQCVRDWIAQFPCFYSNACSEEDLTLARVVRLKRATNGPPPATTALSRALENDDEEADDDGEDLVSRVFLHAIKTHLAPDATWDRVGYAVRLLVAAVEGAYGERP